MSSQVPRLDVDSTLVALRSQTRFRSRWPKWGEPGRSPISMTSTLAKDDPEMLANIFTFGRTFFHPVKRITMWEDMDYSSKHTDKEETGETKRARIEYRPAGEESTSSRGGSQPGAGVGLKCSSHVCLNAWIGVARDCCATCVLVRTLVAKLAGVCV